jgi:c-di-GMP-binding flagellar brake protein YcgR
MTSKNERKAVRLNSLNLSYIGIDENNEIIKQAIGRTLNVSESGILLETHFSIDSKQIVSLTLALEDELINMKGEVVYSRPGEENLFETGVKFLEIDEASQQVLKKYIKTFRQQS